MLGKRVPRFFSVWGIILDDVWIIEGESGDVEEMRAAEEWVSAHATERIRIGVGINVKKTVDRALAAEVQGAELTSMVVEPVHTGAPDAGEGAEEVGLRRSFSSVVSQPQHGGV